MLVNEKEAINPGIACNFRLRVRNIKFPRRIQTDFPLDFFNPLQKDEMDRNLVLNPVGNETPRFYEEGFDLKKVLSEPPPKNLLTLRGNHRRTQSETERTNVICDKIAQPKSNNLLFRRKGSPELLPPLKFQRYTPKSVIQNNIVPSSDRLKLLKEENSNNTALQQITKSQQPMLIRRLRARRVQSAKRDDRLANG
eukprot:TRINITY_DN10484_c0_g1_i1.p1 TRINITY_DN10484_c0_g1~~TRINITY_DN10484_c0_g1_i1.p1  ORF type:complete len:196 (-),score=8.92 TRINITY_DN10484_c0_g1_i1:163-750(-)